MNKNYYTFALIFILFLIIYSDNSSENTDFVNYKNNDPIIFPSLNSLPTITQEADPIIITDDEDLVTYAVRGVGTENDPFIIEGLQITTSSQHGMDISGTTKYMVIQNNIIDTNLQSGIYGIYVNVLVNNTISVSDNTLNNNEIGIYIESGTYSKINDNTITNSHIAGIQISEGAQYSEVSFNNIIAGGITGINIEASNSVIINNTVSMVFDEFVYNYGIAIHRNNVIVEYNFVTGCWEGINISPVENVLISRNLVEGCNSGITGWPNTSLIIHNDLKNGVSAGSGIRLQSELGLMMPSDNNQILYNTITNFEGYGIEIVGIGQNNTFRLNKLIGNSYSTSENSQALDNGYNNTIQENYWNDWLRPDQNNDGYIDISYPISGIANNYDSLPLASLDLAAFNENFDEVLILTDSDLIISQDSELDYTLNSQYIIPIFLVVLTSSLLIPGVKIWKTISNNAVQRLLQKTLISILGYAPPLLIGIINSDTDSYIDQETEIPTELKKYKFLLNPIRLSIIKYLHKYTSYPAYMIRDTLEVSWGKFSSHVNSLINKGYISVQEEFHDESPTRVLYIEHLGNKEYIELRKVLKRLFDLE
ncbi:MAG: hypothetical protein HeimC2_02380 [Candidatus Heimdallarchaeota archaeon LC_2]|nr:MAG: hypothetical protein HeimC2_02380 [Candidatus Heimdallarchaeota archaeon LC_2]